MYAGGGGGGGSYISNQFSNTLAFAGAQDGDGFINIDAVPEPSTWAALITGFGALGAMALRRRRKIKPA